VFRHSDAYENTAWTPGLHQGLGVRLPGLPRAGHPARKGVADADIRPRRRWLQLAPSKGWAANRAPASIRAAVPALACRFRTAARPTLRIGASSIIVRARALPAAITRRRRAPQEAPARTRAGRSSLRARRPDATDPGGDQGPACALCRGCGISRPAITVGRKAEVDGVGRQETQRAVASTTLSGGQAPARTRGNPRRLDPWARMQPARRGRRSARAPRARGPGAGRR